MSAPEETFLLHCKVHHLTPLREYKFHPVRRWKLDFFFDGPRKLGVEIDGGTWVQGRHSRAQGYEADCIKLNNAVLMGIPVLRFTTAMVESGYAIDQVRAFLEAK